MKKTTYQLETLSCPTCTQKIEGALKKTKGIETTDVLFNSSKVKVAYDEAILAPDDISKIIERLGYRVLSVK